MGISASLQAQSDHGHSHGHGSDHGHAQAHAHGSEVKFSSLLEAWSSMESSLKIIEDSIAAKNLTPAHSAEEKLSAGLKYLQKNSSMVTGDKAKRLQSALKQALTVSGQIHGAAEVKNIAKAETEFKKLTGALKLIEAQYPTGVLKAAPSSS
jgi:hypothetical protein